MNTDIERLPTRTVETELQPSSMLVHDGEAWVASYDGYVGLIDSLVDR
ncbi:MAG: hypothetical protein ACLFWH_12325 [Actinomycetota bacterium]